MSQTQIITISSLVDHSYLEESTPSVPPKVSEICQNLNVSICFYCLDTSEFGQI
jgi:hypothetical protein